MFDTAGETPQASTAAKRVNAKEPAHPVDPVGVP
jgi:hypothetical protein